MSLRSGLAAQFGCVAESTWGTGVTVTRFLEMENENIALSVDRIESNAIRASNRVLLNSRWASGKKSAGGDVNFEVASKGFGLIFKQMLGSNVITTPGGGTNTRLHTCTIADLAGVSLTVQVGRPDVSGTVQPFTYTGMKIDQWELSNDIDGILKLKCTFDGQAETTATSLASASYAASDELFYFTEGTISIGGSSYDVSKFSLTGNNQLAKDRFFIRSNATKKEQVPAGLVDLAGSLESEFIDLSAYTRFVNGTTAAFTGVWTGSLIEGALNYSVTVTLPLVRFDGTTPNIADMGITKLTLPFKVVYDGSTAPITIGYQTTDVAA